MICNEWQTHRSLSELCAAAEAAAESPTLDRASIERIYDCEYERHFGRRSSRKRSPTNDVVFGRLFSLCVTEEVDASTFIAANMAALRPALQHGGYAFHPNMLSGEKARARYNAFIRKANRRFGRALGDTAESTSAMGVMRRTLLLDEQEVGDFFVRSAWTGTPISWDGAVEHTNPSGLWRDVEGRQGSEYRSLCMNIGQEGVVREKRLALLRAAVGVANGFREGLADQIGVAEFSWPDLSAVICRTFPVADRMQSDLVGVPGQLWGR